MNNGTESTYSSNGTRNNISATIGHDGLSYANATPASHNLYIQDQAAGTGTDKLSLSSSQSDAIGSHIAQLTFSDASGNALGSSAIPSSLAGLATGDFLYHFSASTADGNYIMLNVNGAVTSLQLLSVSAVPEPESYAMFLGGLVVLGWRRRKAATA